MGDPICTSGEESFKGESGCVDCNVWSYGWYFVSTLGSLWPVCQGD